MQFKNSERHQGFDSKKSGLNLLSSDELCRPESRAKTGRPFFLAQTMSRGLSPITIALSKSMECNFAWASICILDLFFRFEKKLNSEEKNDNKFAASSLIKPPTLQFPLAMKLNIWESWSEYWSAISVFW